MPEKIDPAEIQKRFDRITELFAGMVHHADAVSLTRCPYKDRHDRCTALFGCRFQRRVEGAPEALSCANDGNLDYRSAWEADPDAARAMKARLRSDREG